MAGVVGGNTSSATEKRFLFFPVTLPTKLSKASCLRWTSIMKRQVGNVLLFVSVSFRDENELSEF